MAIKLPDFKFVTQMNAKSRVFFLFGVVIGITGLIYLGARLMGGDSATTGPSKIASAPTGLQSVPGSQLSPEYYRALVQANTQASQQAQISGGSAVPTLINMPGQSSGFPGTDCSIVCPSDETANVADDINTFVKMGKMSQEDANRLLDLAKNNIPVNEYAAVLDELVRQGKLTPEQARQLLERYKKQHDNALLLDSAKVMDPMIKSGQLPLALANELLLLQKKKLTPAEYAAQLEELTKEGKLSPQIASQLLAQYTQQQAGELAKESAAQLRHMVKTGQLTSETAALLSTLQQKDLPVDQYQSELATLVSSGKLTPETAAKLSEQYRKQKSGTASIATLSNMIIAQEAMCAKSMAEDVKNGKLTQGDADTLTDLKNKNSSVADYQTLLNQLVSAHKLSSDEAQKLAGCYQGLQHLKEEAARLAQLQSNNAPLADYTVELKRAVQAGMISPELAAKLLREYQAAITPVGPAGVFPAVQANIPGAEDFAKLQQRLSQQQSTAPPASTNDEAQFQAAEAQAANDAALARQQKIDAMRTAMSGQAQSLIAAWQPPVMQHQEGTSAADKAKQLLQGGVSSATPSGGSANATPSVAAKKPSIKAGTILFAILDTAVNSDYPDTPVMATVVQGKFKGAKLLGKLSMGPNQDRVALSFNLMDMDGWDTTKSVNAFAIDPDTARTVLASNVNYHYMLRYGTIFASSFLSGYANAVQNSGATTTTGIFGSSTGNATYSPAGKIAVGLGQVGNAFTNVVSSYANTPPTVKVNSGVGLGILFMGDVPE